MSRWAPMLSAVVLFAAVAACAGSDGPARLDVAAASDLSLVFPSLEQAVERQCAVEIVVTYGSSGQLAAQIEAGAPFHLFLSANAQYVERLVERGLVEPGDAEPYAVGRLAIVTRSGLPPVRTLAELASRADVARVAIANPEHAPYGAAAVEALAAAGVLEALQGRLVYGENVRQALEYVERGEADAGLVAASLLGPGSTAPLVPSDLHMPIVQVGAALRRERREEARCVLDAIRTEEVQRFLRRYGFEEAPP